MATVDGGEGIVSKDGVVKVEVTPMDVAPSQMTEDQTIDTGGKRKAQASGGRDKKKRFKAASAISDKDKNACMLLNEKCRDVTYDVVSQVGPVHLPIFTVRVTANGETFEGTGPSKKRAKLVAAEIAVHMLNLCNMNLETPNTDILMTDTADNSAAKDTNGQPDLDMPRIEEPADTSAPPIIGKHPVLILNELRPRAEYVALEDEKTESGERKCKLLVDGQTFEGYGHNKKLAKAKAAEEALTKLFGLTFAYLKDGQPIYQGDDTLWTKHKIKESIQLLESCDGKNPIQMLNELFHEVNYEFVDVSNEVTVGTKFCVVVEIQGQTYRGEGTTKKMAKTNSALAAIKALTENGYLANKKAEKEAKKKRTFKPFQGASGSEIMDSAVIKLAIHFPDLQYRLVSQNDMWNNGQMTYTVALTVRGENFFASAPTEKAAKNMVAAKVLSALGLWSAEDVQNREKASKMEADSTNPSFTRGRGGRGFRGRGFSANRGAFRGGTHLGRGHGGFVGEGAEYSSTTPFQGDKELGAPSSYSKWQGRGLRGGRSTSHGPPVAGLSDLHLGQSANAENSSLRSRGSTYSRGGLWGGRSGVASRGGVGRGTSGQSGVDGGVKQGSFGRGSTISQTGNTSYGYHGKSNSNLSQKGGGFSHDIGKYGQTNDGSPYQTHVSNSHGNGSWQTPSLLGVKREETGFSGNTGKASSIQTDHKTNWYGKSKSSDEYTGGSWNTNMSSLSQDQNSAGYDAGWYTENQKSLSYDGAYGTAESASADLYAIQEPYSVHLTKMTAYSPEENYFQPDSGMMSGTSNDAYEYEASADPSYGSYHYSSAETTYEVYSNYGDAVDSYTMGNF